MVEREHTDPQWFYLATDRSGEAFRVLASAVVSGIQKSENPAGMPPSLWWIEVAPDFRRQGFATELLEALETAHPELQLFAGSEDGEAFLAAVQNREAEPAEDANC